MAAADAELADALERQKRAVSLIRGAARRGARAARAARAARGRPGPPGAPARRAAAGSPSRSPARPRPPCCSPSCSPRPAGRPSRSRRLRRAPATGPAPAAEGAMLDIEQDGVMFPAWVEKFGWEATGTRTRRDRRPRRDDRLLREGRQDARVHDRRRRRPRPARRRQTITAEGTPVDIFPAEGGLAATWEREGHTCLLVGAACRTRSSPSSPAGRPRASRLLGASGPPAHAPVDDALARPVQPAHDRPLGHPEQVGALLVGQAHHVDATSTSRNSRAGRRSSPSGRGARPPPAPCRPVDCMRSKSSGSTARSPAAPPGGAGRGRCCASCARGSRCRRRS